MENNKLEVKGQSDVVAARQMGRAMAVKLGFGMADQTRLATAISELTRNVLQYAGTGACTISDESNEATARVRVVVEDNGPGIADVDKAMQDGFSTGSGLGAGLPGTRRLVHRFEIESRPGCTKVTLVMSRRKQ